MKYVVVILGSACLPVPPGRQAISSSRPAFLQAYESSELHRAIMMIGAWLRGMHHHVEDLQDYIDDVLLQVQ